MGTCRILTQDPDKILLKILWDPCLRSYRILQDPVQNPTVYRILQDPKQDPLKS